MHVRRSHKIAAIGLTTALLLAGCGGSDEPESLEEAVGAAEESLNDLSGGDEDADESSEEAEEPEEEAGGEEESQLMSGLANRLSSVPDVEWTEVEESADNVLQAPGTRLRVTQTALLEEISPEVAAQVSEGHGETRLLPSDGEIFLLATVLIEDSQWESAEADSEGTFRVAGNPVPAIAFQTGSGERQQNTYMLSIPEGTPAEEAVAVLTTGDVEQSISLIDGSRVDSDVEPIYQAGTEVTVDGEGWSHEFDSWASGTHEINGQVTGAVITPYVDGWARPGQVFLGVDIDARDDGGSDEDITTIQVELPDGTTVTPDNDHSSLVNRFAERAWFQVPADAKDLILHVNPKGKAGLDEVEFDSPVEVKLTVQGGDAGEQEGSTEAPADDADTTEAPGSTD